MQLQDVYKRQVLNHPGTYRKVAEMEGAESGIGMEVWTDLPGMQFYTANFVEHEEGKEGICYGTVSYTHLRDSDRRRTTENDFRSGRNFEGYRRRFSCDFREI